MSEPDDRVSGSLRRLQPLAPELFLILLALADGACHGYGVVKAVEAESGGSVRLSPSPLYRKLRRLMELGVIARSDKRPAPDLDDERRRYYCLTDAGRTLLEAEARRLVRLGENERIRRLAGVTGAVDA